jgi:hypothetical protein
MSPIYRTIKPFPMVNEASFEADWPWQETVGEYLRVIR